MAGFFISSQKGPESRSPWTVPENTILHICRMLYTEVRSFISSIPQKSCISKSKKEAGSEPSLITRRVHIENPDFPLCFHVEKKVSVLTGMTREERKMEKNLVRIIYETPPDKVEKLSKRLMPVAASMEVRQFEGKTYLEVAVRDDFLMSE